MRAYIDCNNTYSKFKKLMRIKSLLKEKLNPKGK